MQEKLKRDHLANGHTDELNFDYILDDDEMLEDGNIVIQKDSEEEEEDAEDNNDDEKAEEEGEDPDDDLDEDEDEDEKPEFDVIDDEEGEYAQERRLEDRAYDVLGAENEERKEASEEVHFEFNRAEVQRTPHDKSYWTNPQVELIGVHVKKDFGIHGIFKGVIVSWRKPYYKVRFTDNDKEDFKLAEVLPLIDLEYFYDKEEEKKTSLLGVAMRTMLL